MRERKKEKKGKFSMWIRKWDISNCCLKNVQTGKKRGWNFYTLEMLFGTILVDISYDIFYIKKFLLIYN